MSPRIADEKPEILAAQATLARSREELRRLLDRAHHEAAGGIESTRGDAPENPSSHFPRSQTMRALMGGRGLGLSALVGGLLIARPALAWRLLRFLPVKKILKLLID